MVLFIFFRRELLLKIFYSVRRQKKQVPKRNVVFFVQTLSCLAWCWGWDYASPRCSRTVSYISAISDSDPFHFDSRSSDPFSGIKSRKCQICITLFFYINKDESSIGAGLNIENNKNLNKKKIKKIENKKFHIERYKW